MLCAHLLFFFFLSIRRPPRSTRTDTLFPYTTLFRSLRQLIAHERPVSALNACYSQFENIPAALVMEMLKGILKGQEINDGVMPHSYAFQYAVDHIEADGSVDETRLAQIDFALIPCLGYPNEHHSRTLYKVVLSQPGPFVALLCLITNPPH